jgi:hypothetical protein
MDAELWTKLREAALQDGWRRGCTCGSAPEVALLSEGPPRPMLGIGHLRECPLWTDRDLKMKSLIDVEPDSIAEVEL